MCMTDGADQVSMHRTRERTARAEHKCGECRRRIAVGERYTDERYLFDGKFRQHKVCQHCEVVRRWLNSECGGCVYGGIAEDISEHAADGYYGRDVKRLAIGMKWQWTAPSGRRLPVPAVPKTSFELRA